MTAIINGKMYQEVVLINPVTGIPGALPTEATALTPAANGTPLPLASLAQSIAYNPDGTVSHVEVTHDGTTYRQTLTWAAGNLTAVSAWEAQP